jgi:hypothetical protein
MKKPWKKLIEKHSVPELLRALPRLSEGAAYAWKAGRREPPDYSREALLDFLRAKAATIPSPVGPPKVR